MAALRIASDILQLWDQISFHRIHKFFKLAVLEHASHSRIVQGMQIFALDGISAHCIDERLAGLLRKKAESMQSYSKINFGNDTEAQTRLSHALQDIW